MREKNTYSHCTHIVSGVFFSGLMIRGFDFSRPV